MSLTDVLTEKRNNSANIIPADKQVVMKRATDTLIEENLSGKALSIGSRLPNFTLKNTTGTPVSLKNFSSNYLVISFYRGGWCPYCNLELKALQEILPELKKLKGELIAITPETPDNSLTTREKNELTFTVLSDVDNAYAKELGLVFKLSNELQEVYKGFGIHVDKHNENNNFELPMPATYVLNKDREVIYSFIPEDYTERLDPETIIKFLKE